MEVAIRFTVRMVSVITIKRLKEICNPLQDEIPGRLS
jgi:hypothetical protein